MLQFVIQYGLASRALADKIVPLLARSFCRPVSSYVVIREEVRHNSTSLKKKSDVFFRIVCTPHAADGLRNPNEAEESAAFVSGVVSGMNLAKKESQKKANRSHAEDIAKARMHELDLGKATREMRELGILAAE